MFEEAERKAYDELRTRGNDRASGISIEHIQQFTRVIVETEGDGEGQTTTRREDLYMLVQYWHKPVAIEGAVEVSEKAPPRDWSLERGASKP
jgi:hypothetical protein